MTPESSRFQAQEQESCMGRRRLLPTGLGVNPMITIESVAHKIARGIAAELC